MILSADHPDGVLEIRLDHPSAECVLCGAEEELPLGLACYEDLLVDDDYQGPWGGQPACRICFNAWGNGVLEPGMTFHQARARLVGLALGDE